MESCWSEDLEDNWYDPCKYGQEHHDQFYEHKRAKPELRRLIKESLEQHLHNSNIHIQEENMVSVLDTLVDKLSAYSRYVVRVQRRHNDPMRLKKSPHKEGGNGTGMYLCAGHSLFDMFQKCTIKVDENGTTFTAVTTARIYGDEFIFQSDPRALEKLKFDLKNRNFILTNHHVIMSEYEAKSACIDFFFDEPGKGPLPPKGLVRAKVTGMYPLYSSKRKPGQAADLDHLDFCLLTFYIKNEDRKSWEDNALSNGMLLINKMVLPCPENKDLLICFGHPHGKSKKLSTGRILESTQNDDGSSKIQIRYHIPTCHGSSGGYVFCVAFRGTQYYHFPAFMHFVGVHSTQSEQQKYLHGHGIMVQSVHEQITSWFELAKQQTSS